MRVRWTAMVYSLGTLDSPELVAATPSMSDESTMGAVDLIRVRGGARLAGQVSVVGAKNSALKLMAAALLAPGRSALTNVPRITDIALMAEVLRRLGCEVEVRAPAPVAAGL